MGSRPRRVTIGGFTSIASNGAAAPLSATTNGWLPGPGVVLLGGLLGLLQVPVRADLEVGTDPCGVVLDSLLAPAFPYLRITRRLAPGAETAQLHFGAAASSERWTLPLLRDHSPCVRPLNVEGQPSRSLGVWCYPPSCLWREGRLEDEFRLELANLHRTGLTQMLTLQAPYAARASGEAWQQWLQQVLPHTDIVCGQADDLLQMLDSAAAERLAEEGKLHDPACWLNGGVLHSMGGFLLSCGAGVVAIGLRDHGVYLRTNSDADRVAFLRRFAPDSHVAAFLAEWIGREMLIPLFQVEVCNRYARTDAMAAGLVGSLLQGLDPGETLRMMAAVVSFASEWPNPMDALAPWDVVVARADGGWAQARCGLDLSGWDSDESPW